MFVGGWDLTFNYLYHYADIPVIRRIFLPTAGFFPTIQVTTTYARTHLAGTTFSNAFGSLTVRGELGFSKDRFFLTDDLTDIDGVFKTDEFSYVLGFDWFGITDTFLSVQLFQSIVTDRPAGMSRNGTDTNLTLLLQRNALNEQFQAELLWVQNIGDGDGFARPKISYELEDGFKIWSGIDFFYGKNTGLFGQYDNNDRFLLGGEWGF